MAFRGGVAAWPAPAFVFQPQAPARRRRCAMTPLVPQAVQQSSPIVTAVVPADTQPEPGPPPFGERRARRGAAALSVWEDPQPYLQRLDGLLNGCSGQARLSALLVVEVLPADPDRAVPLMQAIGQRLCQSLRATDEVAQLGADRFTVLLFDAGEYVSSGVRTRLDQALHQPYELQGRAGAWPLLRIGRAVHGLDGQRAAELLRAAQLPAGD